MKKTKVLSVIAAAFFLVPLVFFLAQMRVNYTREKAESALIQHLSGFLNAVDQQLFVFSAIPNRNTRLFERMQNQLRVYEATQPGRKYFSVVLRDGKPFIKISSNQFPSHTVGSFYPLDSGIIEKVFVQSVPLVVKSLSSDSSKIIRKVFVPMMGDKKQSLSMVAVMELDDSEVSARTDAVKYQTLTAGFILVFLLLLVGTLLLYREEQPLEIKNRYKHIETAGVFLIGLWTLIIFLTTYREHQRHEQKIIFEGYAENYSTNLRNVLRTMRHDLEQFSNFVLNSEVVDSIEFRYFATEICQSSPFSSFLYFETSAEPTAGAKIILSNEAGQNYYLKFVFNISGENGLPFVPSKEIQDAINKNLTDSEKDNLVYSSDLLTAFKNNKNQDIFILGIVIHSNDIMPIGSGTRKYIAATFDPKFVLTHTFRRHEWLKSTIAIGLMQYFTNKHADWIAAYPPDHLDKHSGAGYQKHLENYSFSQTYPIFIWGKILGISAHSMPEYEEKVKGFSIFFLTAAGSALLLFITLLVFLIRHRWTIMESVIESRTRNLDRRIKDLNCIRRVGDILQSGKTNELLYHEIIRELEFTLAVQDVACVELLIDGMSYKTKETKPACVVKLTQDITIAGEKAGWIALISCKQLDFQQEDNALLTQVAGLISDHIVKIEFEKALKESELKFRSLVENAFDAIYMLEGRHFTYVNKAFCELIGYEASELTALSFDMDILLTPLSKQIVQKRFEDRKNGIPVPHRYEFQQLSKKGKVIDVEASTISVVMEGRKVIIGMLHDITERKHNELALKLSEERLQQQNEELQVLNEELQDSNEHIRVMNSELLEAKIKAEASDKLKSAFLNNISHELRTPLNGILGAASVIMEENNTPDERAEMAEVLRQSTDRLMRTIHQYVDISMFNSGSMPVHGEVFNIRKFLQPLIERSTRTCILKKIQINFEFLNVEEATIYTDKNLLYKILDHLLDNAIKFTQYGSVSCLIKNESGDWIIQIQDTGIGIDEHFKEHIYELFMQEDVSNIRKYDGNGLGLAIVKKSCDMLGADLRFESEKGKGTTFTVSFKNTGSNVISTKSTPNTMISSNNESPLILIAEDEDSNFIVLNMLLAKRLNAKLLRASDGAQAVQLCRENAALDLVLMDIKMPVLDGYEATKLIKQFRPNLPIIAITAYGLTGDEHRAISSGCDDYLAKPIQSSILLEKINHWLHTR